MDKKHFLTGVILFCALVVLGLSASDIFSEQKETPRKPPTERVQRELTRYGNFLDTGLGWEGVAPAFLRLDMRKLFDYEAERWSRITGKPNPFFPSVALPLAREQWYSEWVHHTCFLLAGHGWKVKGIDERGCYLFALENPPPFGELPPFLKAAYPNAEIELPTMPEKMEGRGILDMRAPFPPSLYNWLDVMLVPPWAHSVRIYSAIPVNAHYYDFSTHLPFLHLPSVRRRAFKMEYDGGRFNVVRFRFLRNTRTMDDFWSWQLFNVRLQAFKQFPIGGETRKWEWDLSRRGPWIGWEFLDEDGKPLPADLPIAVRWFADDFDKIFKPIPLPEELKALPEAQD